MIDHMGFDCTDYRRSRAFYEQALAPLGLAVVMEVTKEQSGGYEGCGFGQDGKPEFGSARMPVRARSLCRSPCTSRSARRTGGMVDAFYAAALAAGGRDNGAPGLRPHYHPNYYAAFVFDPDGHNIEAVCHSPGIVR